MKFLTKNLSIQIREEIIKQTNGSKWMMVKNHFDAMVGFTFSKHLKSIYQKLCFTASSP